MPTSTKRQLKKPPSASAVAKRKALNRIRTSYGRSNMSDKEANFIYKALRDKKPAGVLLDEIKNNCTEVLSKFDMITDLATHTEGDKVILDIIRTSRPELYTAISDAAEYLTGVNRDIEVVYQSIKDELVDDVSPVTLMGATPVVEAFDKIMDDVFTQTVSLLGVIEMIHQFHREVSVAAQVSGLNSNV